MVGVSAPPQPRSRPAQGLDDSQISDFSDFFKRRRDGSAAGQVDAGGVVRGRRGHGARRTRRYSEYFAMCGLRPRRTHARACAPGRGGASWVGRAHARLPRPPSAHGPPRTEAPMLPQTWWTSSFRRWLTCRRRRSMPLTRSSPTGSTECVFPAPARSRVHPSRPPAAPPPAAQLAVVISPALAIKVDRDQLRPGAVIRVRARGAVWRRWVAGPAPRALWAPPEVEPLAIADRRVRAGEGRRRHGGRARRDCVPCGYARWTPRSGGAE